MSLLLRALDHPTFEEFGRWVSELVDKRHPDFTISVVWDPVLQRVVTLVSGRGHTMTFEAHLHGLYRDPRRRLDTYAAEVYISAAQWIERVVSLERGPYG